MKKKLLSMLLVVCCLCLAACSPSEPEQETPLEFDFSKAIGLTKEKALKKLKISEESLEEMKTGRYHMKEPVTILDIDFTKYLLFDYKSDIFHAGGYQYVVEYDKALYDKVMEIKAELDILYGDPITYPGLSSALSYITEFPEPSEEIAYGYSEEWQAKDESCIITLSATIFENKVWIDVRYKMQPDLDALLE